MRPDETIMKLEIRFGDYGVKPACVIGKDNSTFCDGDGLDLIKYEPRKGGKGELNYTVGTWRKTSEGYRFESIGDRLFTEIDPYEAAEIWPILRSVQKLLDGLYV